MPLTAYLASPSPRRRPRPLRTTVQPGFVRGSRRWRGRSEDTMSNSRTEHGEQVQACGSAGSPVGLQRLHLARSCCERVTRAASIASRVRSFRDAAVPRPTFSAPMRPESRAITRRRRRARLARDLGERRGEGQGPSAAEVERAKNHNARQDLLARTAAPVFTAACVSKALAGRRRSATRPRRSTVSSVS